MWEILQAKRVVANIRLENVVRAIEIKRQIRIFVRS
jgi:hypothetical protein